METSEETLPTPRPYFRLTTVSQREYLFRQVEKTGNVSEAARQAHVGRGTYYYWQTRYKASGTSGLAEERSRAPKQTRIAPVGDEVSAEVIAYYREHPQERGYRTIAQRLRQNHGQRVIGHNKVGEILRAARAAGQLGESTPPAPSLPCRRPELPVVYAPDPGQTVHIDLCVVPVTHDGIQELASVSTGAAANRAVPTPKPPSPPMSDSPGMVFGDKNLSYADQMRAYEARRRAKRASKGQRKHLRRQKQDARQELNAQNDELRLKRRRQRLERRQEEADWREKRAAQRQAVQKRHKQTHAEKRAARQAWNSEHENWRIARQQRDERLEKWRAEDEAWKQTRLELRTALAEASHLPLPSTWLAILVVVDSASRRCLQLPLFVTGPHVSADESVAALRAHWPDGIQFLVSDNGAQFIAEAFARFANDKQFLHVSIAPHHPQTNGIAERFVLTVKQWLETHSWNSSDELEKLLSEFIAYYNERPHQGAGLNGLSPNEYLARRQNCSTC